MKNKVKIMGKFLMSVTGKYTAAITLAPFGIYVRKNFLNDKSTINHESIHWKQQMETLVIPFYIWYLLEWFIKLFFYGKNAYYEISFEQEAYDNQYDLDYLNKRKHYMWLKYVFYKDKNIYGK
jgi:hypothetical protein